MGGKSLFDRCKINTNFGDDVFVGISRKNDELEVSFPLGYRLSKDEKGVRKDILSLINTLAKNTEKKESELVSGGDGDETTNMPIQSYLYLIKDFLERGYYKENEVDKVVAKRGKIDWNRTIKTQKPYLQDDEAYYLNYVVKKNTINEDELITLVHRYCVYESFEKLGWLFTSFIPAKPPIVLSKKIMLRVVNEKLKNTFIDRNKLLFKSMISVIRLDDSESDTEFKYGTKRFEYVWEKMIDRVFGISEKENYFPKTNWNFEKKEPHNNAFLEPDSIMLVDDKIFVLDAKYYKYGYTGVPNHLPESTSINKQITYGEFIAEHPKFIKEGKHPTVYNAFIMPYNSKGKRFYTDKPIHFMGYATSEWKKGNKEYENVIGVLMDVRYLMELESRLDYSEMIKLAEVIESNCNKLLNERRNIK